MPEATHQGRVAVVTGGGRGLGRAMALGLLGAGARVVAVDVEPSAFESLVEEARRTGAESSLACYAGDITRDDAADAAIREAQTRFGGVDILVNNAGLNLESLLGPGVTPPANFWDVTPEQVRRIFDVNAIAPFLLVRAALPAMRARGWGRIINVTTSLDTMYRRGMLPYGGSKAATEAHSAVMAAELAESGITVNVLVPGGPVRSRMTVSFREPERLLQPDVMVEPLLWLTSPAADAVTGQRFIAARWDASLAPAEAIAKAGAPIAWPQLGSQAILPR